MGLGFLVPAFLAGFAALAIPLLMHLRDRNEETPTRFPSLMFLVRLPIRTSDRRKVTDWPLLLLRALIVALLVAAFARPFLGRAAATSTDRRIRAVVLLLDRSMSMGYQGTWAVAQDSARAVLKALAPDDQVSVVLFDEDAEVAQRWTLDHAAARTLVDATEPVARGTRFGAALRVARSALIGAPPGAPEIVIVTDLQRSGLTGVAGLDLPAGLPLRVISVAPANRPNTALVGVDAHRVPDGTRQRLQVQARVVTRELAAARTARLSLRLAGREVGTRTAVLPANGELSIGFDGVAAPTGAVDGEVTIESDALAGDDRLRFSLSADDALIVVLVLPDDLARDETLFLERALAVGRSPAIRLERRRAGAVDAATLARANLLVYWDVSPPSGAAGTAIDAWVAAGGGMLVSAGPRLGSRRRTALGAVAMVNGLADRRAGGGALLGEIRSEHPIFTPFRASSAALMAPRFYRHARLEPVVGADVLARFDDGAPAVLERSAGEGRVLLLALGLDVRESDLPLQPAFLPLLRGVVLHTAGHESTPLWRRTGESWIPRQVRRAPVIVAPDGSLIRAGPSEVGIAVILDHVGVYTAYEGRVDGAPRAQVAVNVGPAESDLTRADPRELLLGVGNAADSTLRNVGAPTSIEIESRQRAWRILLGLAALLLMTETVVASRGWRGKARRATIVASEMAKG